MSLALPASVVACRIQLTASNSVDGCVPLIRRVFPQIASNPFGERDHPSGHLVGQSRHRNATQIGGCEQGLLMCGSEVRPFPLPFVEGYIEMPPLGKKARQPHAPVYSSVGGVSWFYCCSTNITCA